MFSSVSLQRSIHHPASCCLFRSELLSKVSPLFLPTREEDGLPSSRVLWLAQTALSTAPDSLLAAPLINTPAHTPCSISTAVSPDIRKQGLRRLLALSGPCDVQYRGNEAFSLCSGGTWATRCQPGVRADCDKEQHTEHFLSLFFLFVFFFLSSLLKKQVLAWIREKLHHLEEKKRNGKGGGKYEKKSGNQTQIHLHI